MIPDHVSNLKVFQRAYALSLELHRETLRFPEHEQREMACQLRRASKSICANLVEGIGKNQSVREKIRFIYIAIGSKDEVALWLLYARDLGYLAREASDYFNSGYAEVGKMLYGLKENLAKKLEV